MFTWRQKMRDQFSKDTNSKELSAIIYATTRNASSRTKSRAKVIPIIRVQIDRRVTLIPMRGGELHVFGVTETAQY